MSYSRTSKPVGKAYTKRSQAYAKKMSYKNPSNYTITKEGSKYQLYHTVKQKGKRPY